MVKINAHDNKFEIDGVEYTKNELYDIMDYAQRELIMEIVNDHCPIIISRDKINNIVDNVIGKIDDATIPFILEELEN